MKQENKHILILPSSELSMLRMALSIFHIAPTPKPKNTRVGGPSMSASVTARLSGCF